MGMYQLFGTTYFLYNTYYLRYHKLNVFNHKHIIYDKDPVFLSLFFNSFQLKTLKCRPRCFVLSSSYMLNCVSDVYNMDYQNTCNFVQHVG